MITCRPSGPARSLTSPSSAKSIARAPMKLVVEGARGTTVGSAFARQNTVAWSAESFGSTAKGKPPTPDEGIPGAALEAGVGGILAHDSLVVFLISRITAQELPRKTGPIEVLQVVASPDAPVGTSRHLSSPKTWPPCPGDGFNVCERIWESCARHHVMPDGHHSPSEIMSNPFVQNANGRGSMEKQ